MLPILLVVGSLFGFLIYSPYFRIETISIEGTDRLEEDDVRSFLERTLTEKALYVIPQDIMWMSKYGLASIIKSHSPVIKDVHITRSWPHELAVEVVEYSGWGVLCQGLPEDCYWIDRAGVAFQSAPDFAGTIVPKITDERDREITLGEKQMSQRMMRLITFFNERAQENDYLQSLQFAIDARDATLHAETRAGWEIRLLEDTDPEEAYKNMQLTLDNEIKEKADELDYIDLRFGNRIFYRFIEYDR